MVLTPTYFFHFISFQYINSFVSLLFCFIHSFIHSFFHSFIHSISLFNVYYCSQFLSVVVLQSFSVLSLDHSVKTNELYNELL